MKKDLLGQIDKDKTEEPSTKDQGLLDLELKPEREADIPESKGGNVSGSDVVVLDVNEFAVDILDGNGAVVKHYDSYADLKKEGGLLLPAGNYSIRATLGDDVNAGFDKPFYSGTNVCEITPQDVAKVITDCALSNKKVTFRCSDEFLTKFKDDYSIAIDNNAGALITQKGETRISYLKNTGVLQFTIYATLKNGSKNLIYNYDMSKNDQVQEHNNILIDLDLVEDNPSPDPGPGDPDEPSDPGDPELPVDTITVKAPAIKVDISLIEKEFVIEVPSDFVDAGDSGDEGGGDNPGGDPGETPTTPAITGSINGKSFDVNTAQTISSSTKSVIINLYLPTGLEGLDVFVKIGESIKMPLNLLDKSAVDLINGILPEGKKLVVPAKGEKGNLKFDISPFLSLLEAKSSFAVTVKDKNGESSNATITLEKK